MSRLTLFHSYYNKIHFVGTYYKTMFIEHAYKISNKSVDYFLTYHGSHFLKYSFENKAFKVFGIVSTNNTLLLNIISNSRTIGKFSS